MYKWRGGMLSWILHRISGIGLVIFIIIHIEGMFHIAKGPKAFNDVIAMYNTPLFKVLEIFLFAAIMFHAVNGLRVILLDFASGSRYPKPLIWSTYIVTGVVFLVGVYFLWT